VVLFRIAAKGWIGTRNVQYTSNRIGRTRRILLLQWQLVLRFVHFGVNDVMALFAYMKLDHDATELKFTSL